VTGQQQQPVKDSAEETDLGGGGGDFLFSGGGTKPGSSSPVPLWARIVPVQRVTSNVGIIDLSLFIFSPFLLIFFYTLIMFAQD
jgi:hypothetical protein